MVTLVSGVDENWVDPNVAPAALLVRLTVSAPPVEIGAPEAVWRATVIGPRFEVLDVAPDTAGDVMTRLPVVIVRVKVWDELAWDAAEVVMQSV
jgi:hypothetical protein